MNPDRIKSIRSGLGLSQMGLAEALRLGPNGKRTVRRWETGEIVITGPASLALECMEKHGVGLKKNTERHRRIEEEGG